MHIAEVFEKFLSGRLTMTMGKAKTITKLVADAQAGLGQWASFPLVEDIDQKKSLHEDYKKLIGQEVSFVKILGVAENYDIWHCRAENSVEELAAVIEFIKNMVKMSGDQDSK